MVYSMSGDSQYNSQAFIGTKDHDLWNCTLIEMELRYTLTKS